LENICARLLNSNKNVIQNRVIRHKNLKCLIGLKQDKMFSLFIRVFNKDMPIIQIIAMNETLEDDYD